MSNNVVRIPFRSLPKALRDLIQARDYEALLKESKKLKYAQSSRSSALYFFSKMAG